MRRTACAVAAAGVVAGGGCDGPAREPAARFGRMTAVVGGAPVVGAWGPDSVVAVYGVHSGTLQIEGARVDGGAWSDARLPVVRVLLACEAPPGPGVYRVAGFTTPVHAEAFLAPRGVGGWWPHRWWPRDWWPGRGESRAFLSDSARPGVLELDTLDLAGGRVYGRFRATVRSIGRAPAESLALAGTFWGRVRTFDFRRPGDPPVRRSPLFDRDCAAARRPPPAPAG